MCWKSFSCSDTQAYYAPLTPQQRAWPAIGPKELLAIVLWLELFGAEYAGSFLLVGTDNSPNVYVVNNLRVHAGDAVVFSLLERLLAACDRHDIDCIVFWCPRALNGISDALSKSLSLLIARRVAHRFSLRLREDPAPPSL
jgi:hypothetical protein